MAENFRETELTVDLGGEQVEFVSLNAREAISTPFEMELVITAPLGEFDLAPHLGESVSVKVAEDEETVRYFNGYLAEATYLRESSDGIYYRLTLKSFLHFLDSRIGFRICQEMSVLDVVKEVFSDAKISNYEFRTSESYEPYEYCVQYAESDFHFVSRLLENEGLYYFFEHGEAEHRLIICDRNSSHLQSDVDRVSFNPAGESSQSRKVANSGSLLHNLTRWVERVATTSHDTVSMRDFDFKKPAKPVEGKSTNECQHPQDANEFYDYPGQFIDENRGSRLSRVRLEELRSLRRSYGGETTAKGLVCGTKISVEGHPNERLNNDYWVVSTVHVLQSEGYHSGGAAHDSDEVHFTAIPADVQYRPARKTDKPRIVGLESAIVTGPEGETIYTDEYGRIKVRFHWDRSGTPDEKSTCWIRVSQTGGLGNIILPRVGHEVLVDFLHGDPDQPVITGRVFNQDHMPIYDLPANKTRATWRTLTYGKQASYPETQKLDTGEPKANELRFEDKGGKEEVFFHAERDMNVRVRFDYSQHVGHDEEWKVGHDRERTVENDEKVRIKGNRTFKLTGNETDTILKGNREVTLKKGDDTLTLNKGDISITSDMGKIKIEAMQKIELIVGQTKLVLTPTKAKLVSTQVDVTGEATTKLAAGAIMTQKGGLIKIN